MSAEWIEETVSRISEIGRTIGGGSDRQGFTEADEEARKYFISLIKEAGLKPVTDSVGNISARFGGKVGQAAVATGSHIDTVPDGGRYDGVLGAVTSLAAIKSLKNEGVNLKNPLELIIFQLEESSRFGHSTIGSKVLTGTAPISAWKSARDKNGVTFPDALKSAGLDFDKIDMARRKPEEFKAFIELHIDQSGDLERAGKPIGIVEAVAAPIRSKVTVRGEAGHSGSTKMHNRKDALVSAAELALAVRNLALAYAEQKIVATVGDLRVYPGAMNVIPGLAELDIDLRGTDKRIMDEVYGILKDESSKIALRRGTPMEIELLSEENPAVMDKKIYSLIKTVCRELEIPCENVVSGAGHDAMNMARITPSGMIFVRNLRSAGHNPKEYVSKNDMEKGFLILREVLKRLASS